MVKNVISRIAGGLFHVFMYAAIAVGINHVFSIIFEGYNIPIGYRIAYGVMIVVAFAIGATSKTTITIGGGKTEGDADNRSD